MRIMTERYGRSLLDRPGGANSQSPLNPMVMRFVSRRPRAPNISRLTLDVTIAVASFLMAAVRCSPALLAKSLFREARPFTSTMA
jgi:hypothetical protein